MTDKYKEEVFYAKEFNFSYSSLNKLLFSPSLFYKDYILLDREVRTDKHLIEGKLIHCLLFEPDKLEEKFNVVPGKSPSDNVRRVMKDMMLYTDASDLDQVEDFIILDSLKHMNLYQSLKADEARIAKIRIEDHKPYWKFLSNPIIDVINEETFERCNSSVEILKSNKEVEFLFKNESKNDFELASTKSFSEKYIQCNLNDKPFGLHGFIDYYKIDDENKQVIICDLKTTSKTISEFDETVEYYNYWMQAAIYLKLVMSSVDEFILNGYDFLFKFVVIDKYDQVYVFDVSDATMSDWGIKLKQTLEMANYHYLERNYKLPYNFLVNKPLL